MTNTITEVTLTDAEWALVLDQARELGADYGKAAGTWVEIDSAEAARRILDGIEAGDPEILDMCPSPLSGEWADSLNEAGLIDELDLVADSLSEEERAEVVTAFEQDFYRGYWDEVQRMAQLAANDLL